jgi:hypothetical protein
LESNHITPGAPLRKQIVNILALKACGVTYLEQRLKAQNANNNDMLSVLQNVKLANLQFV